MGDDELMEDWMQQWDDKCMVGWIDKDKDNWIGEHSGLRFEFWLQVRVTEEAWTIQHGVPAGMDRRQGAQGSNRRKGQHTR